ncbi:tRNA-N(6)-(isopentenyl)adenosine-37 thiotransferase enzyme MiaB [Bernardetia litoralis DSM 6794]|uniref:tRNA-2-methylthio-N(6)-dimethylallyladenosine synthase n=1 Tax=Bernardetia litoralis (strain ATCC 23117 / DSM 6794 / NBRC 15988 / NCIMB 1366 / Fx l1 / Sio-4) TaxID=880071 RepID=I4AML6_BERLS|nr:tRNA (N6-isopentenyl adenosine(37)-C2)-methylthiotransferase MiaB [Bernardetia litoralis]AFM05201.1 tRNA-N(6)-(isopentenyl)adenosine-37 thiotransferase enzyme MiaB [Bernardetia litoralis DSM 6794]
MNKLIADIDIVDVASEAIHEPCETVKKTADNSKEGQRKLYIESYGCQMNFADSEVVAAVMQEHGFGTTNKAEDADLIFLNTCSIREKAEQTVRKRLVHINGLKKRKPEMMVGVLGCMAERLKHKFLEEEKIVDLVAGPDAYRDLPKLIGSVDDGQKAVNVLLSREETYADIAPIRLNSNGISAFVSIMRGCDNVCSFCVVPFTRGRERSRPADSIVQEIKDLVAQGYKEVTLLGQNVDSYKWTNVPRTIKAANFEAETGQKVRNENFATLLEMVAQIDSNLRVRFTTSHPKDMTDDVLHVMAKYENICKYIHLPVQSGNSRVLKLMNRTYSREWYIDRVDAIRRILGDDCAISSDMIAGFCTETEEEHQETLTLMEYVNYDYSYMFFYSERPGTLAAKKYLDDIPMDIKKKRLSQIIELQSKHSLARNQRLIGKTHKVLVEGESKRSDKDLQGRTTDNKVIIFPRENYEKGQYVNVSVHDCTSATLFGKAIEIAN